LHGSAGTSSGGFINKGDVLWVLLIGLFALGMLFLVLLKLEVLYFRQTTIKHFTMKKNPLQGLGRRLGLHILIPVAYFLTMLIALVIKYWHS
jgi:hypothetical protein